MCVRAKGALSLHLGVAASALACACLRMRLTPHRTMNMTTLTATLRRTALFAMILATSWAGHAQDAALQAGIDSARQAATAAAATAQRSALGKFEERGAYAKDVLGLGDTTALAEPGRGMRAGAQAEVSGFADFACKLQPGTSKSAAGVLLEFQGCDAAATSMQLAICTAALRGDACPANSAELPKVTLTAGAYSQFEGLTLGLGCNAEKACRVTVQGRYALQGNDSEIRSQAQALRGQQSASSYTAALGKVAASDDYLQRFKATGQQSQDCWQANSASLSRTGTALDCSTGKPIAVAAAASSASSADPACSQPERCLRWAGNTTASTFSCTRTFPLTVKSSQLVISSTLTCTTTVDTVKGTSTNSCDTAAAALPAASAASGASSGPAEPTASAASTDPRVGLTKVGQSDVVCTTPAPVSASPAASDASPACQVSTFSEFYADLRAASVSERDVTASPAPLSTENPICDSVNAQAQCTSGNWFGRTLAADQCTVAYADDDGSIASAELTYKDKAGCGVCLQSTVQATCYGQSSELDTADTCTFPQGKSCSLVSTVAGDTTNAGGEGGPGLVASQQETYRCTATKQTCLEFAPPPAQCVNGGGVNTFGLTTPARVASETNFGNSLSQLALVDGIAKGVQEGGDITAPRIFSGEDLRCERPTGGVFGQLLQKNCCRTNLERPKKGSIIQQGCNENEVKLAASRRANMAVYIGSRCTKKSGFPRKCVRQQQTYCAFRGLLSKLVQEQGRVQLAQIAASSAGAEVQRQELSYSYYADAGRWTSPISVNGVKVAAWQMPAYCRTPEAAAAHFAGNPTALDCPSTLQAWVATCDAPDGCGALPTQPLEGGLGWALQPLDPLHLQTVAISRFAVARGACDPASQQCQYTVSAWPAGKGGHVTVTRDISFAIFSGQATATESPLAPTMGNAADIFYRTYTAPGALGAALPATVRMDFSVNGGGSWISVNVPTSSPNSTSVPGTDITVTGDCSAASNQCSFRLQGTTTVSAKPWGGPSNPDCTGFTAGQLGALDFGKMDLSQWIQETIGKSAAQGLEGASNAAQIVSAQLDIYQPPDPTDPNRVATQRGSAPQSPGVGIAIPAEGFGPFTVTLSVGGLYPSATDPNAATVNSVTVDWGDCSAPQQLNAVTAFNGQAARGFSAAHTYRAPNDAAHVPCGVARDGTVVHQVKLTLQTSAGTRTGTLAVTNSWEAVSGVTGGNRALVPDSKAISISK